MSLRPSLYTIPARFSFVDALARGIKDMADKAATFPLADYQIFASHAPCLPLLARCVFAPN